MQFLEKLRYAQPSYRASFRLRPSYHLTPSLVRVSLVVIDACARQAKRAAIEVSGHLYAPLDAIDATRRRAPRRGPRLNADSGAFTMRTKLKV